MNLNCNPCKIKCPSSSSSSLKRKYLQSARRDNPRDSSVVRRAFACHTHYRKSGMDSALRSNGSSYVVRPASPHLVDSQHLVGDETIESLKYFGAEHWDIFFIWFTGSCNNHVLFSKADWWNLSVYREYVWSMSMPSRIGVSDVQRAEFYFYLRGSRFINSSLLLRSISSNRLVF